MQTTKKKLNMKKYTMNQLRPVILAAIVVGLSLLFAIINPDFISLTNIHAILLTMVTVGIITIGQSVCKMADYFDMSVGMVASMGGLAVPIVIEAGGSVGMGMMIGVLIGIVAGLLAGFLVSFMGMNSFITTFALQSAYRGIIYIFTDGLSKKMFGEVYAVFTNLGSYKVFGAVQLPIVAMFVLYIAIHLFLKYTKLGRSIFLAGGNAKCAHISGINVTAVQIFIFVLCDTLAAIAGMLYGSRMANAQAFMAATIPLESIAATVVGGVIAGNGNMFQAFLGVLIIFLVKNGLIMIGLPDYYQYIAVGVIMFVAVALQTERKKN